jgi:sporulation protein YlmC with PRC-barrel domain
VVPPDPNRETLPNRYLLIRPRNIAAFEARQDARQEANGAGGADTARAEEIRDRVVLGADGKPVGTVDYVMLDIKAGRIAYLLLSSGDFLGLGGEWVPVPPEALSWPPDKETAVLKNGLKRSALKPLQRSELPNFIRGAQLEALYQRFDVAPYQQQSQLE